MLRRRGLLCCPRRRDPRPACGSGRVRVGEIRGRHAGRTEFSPSRLFCGGMAAHVAPLRRRPLLRREPLWGDSALTAAGRSWEEVARGTARAIRAATDSASESAAVKLGARASCRAHPRAPRRPRPPDRVRALWRPSIARDPRVVRAVAVPATGASCGCSSLHVVVVFASSLTLGTGACCDDRLYPPTLRLTNNAIDGHRHRKRHRIKANLHLAATTVDSDTRWSRYFRICLVGPRGAYARRPLHPVLSQFAFAASNR